MAYSPYASVKQMKHELKTWSPSWGNQVSTRAIIYACERLDEIAALLRRPVRKPRKASAWQRFFATGMKAGKTPKQIATEWKKRLRPRFRQDAGPQPKTLTGRKR